MSSGATSPVTIDPDLCAFYDRYNKELVEAAIKAAQLDQCNAVDTVREQRNTESTTITKTRNDMASAALTVGNEIHENEIGDREIDIHAGIGEASDNKVYCEASDTISAEEEPPASTASAANTTKNEAATLPPLEPGEYDTVIPTDKKGRVMIHLKLTKDGSASFHGYKRYANRRKAMAEKKQLCGAIGDQLIAVGGTCVLKKGFRKIVALIRNQGIKNKQICLRFRPEQLPAAALPKSSVSITNEEKNSGKHQLIQSAVIDEDESSTSKGD